MQKNALIALVGVLVVVVVIVAAVLLLNKPAATPGGGTQGGTAGGGTQGGTAGGGAAGGGAAAGGAAGGGAAAGGTAGGGAAGGGTAGGGTTAGAIGPTTPMECQITMPEGSMQVKIMPPKKMRMTMTTSAGSALIISDGLYVYICDQSTNSCLKSAITSDTAYDINPSDYYTNYQTPPAGYTYNCQPVGSIPDSEFQPPAGAQVTDLSAYGGAGYPY